MSGEIESARLLLKPLSLCELRYIDNNELVKIQPSVEQEALLDSTKIAISKKIVKMRHVKEKNHEWYTYWLIINKENQKGIGFIGLKGIPDQNGYSEVGYSISPAYRGKGIMTEALSLLLNWALQFPACKGITATKVLKSNIGSNKVLNKCNFKLDSASEEYNNYILNFSSDTIIHT